MTALRSLAAYRKLISQHPEFRVLSTPLSAEMISRTGFPVGAAAGDSIVPASVGPTTLFNASGREIVRRDLPKETRSQMIYTSWKDWHGNTHHGTQYRDYIAYPRDLVPPPGVELTLVTRGPDLLATSRVFRRDEEEGSITHVLNMFLELFGQLDIAHPNFVPTITVKRINWKILPPGTYPFVRAEAALEDYFHNLPQEVRSVAKYRIKEVTRHNPDFIAIGVGGFNDYVVFGFTASRRFVLESPFIGNATYIFRNDWEQFASLSKADILKGNFHEHRIVHNKHWSRQLRDAVQRI